MKTLVLYYSYSGHARALAQSIAEQEHADVAEIRDIKRPNILKAYVLGAPAAMKAKEWPIAPLGVKLGDYECLHIVAPVWAGNPAPQVNALFVQIPAGKSVRVTMVSASGTSKCQPWVAELIRNRGSVLDAFADVRG
ncbi:MAG: hypothetical protein LBN05_02195 [Oscillospiraceae bacterium]|jgi:hypothetical protein|nr:hypothetical protein [Oscillospiraceae bacterium]